MKGMERGFTVEGLNLERFIRLAGEQDIPMTRMRRRGRRLTAVTEESRLAALAALAEKGGWRFRIGRLHGAGRGLDALLRRWPLVAGLVAALLAVGVASQFVWRVDIVDAGLYQADVASYLQEQGIRPMMPKRAVDLPALRDSLEYRYPHIAWADCGWRGLSLQVTLVQGTPVGDTLTHVGSGDVIASRGGVVESVITVAGTPQVQPGDVVRPGDVLILGQERTGAEETIPVMARGQVMARVWDGATVRIPATQTETHPTGRIQEARTIAGPFFALWPLDPPCYEHCDVTRRTMPLGGLFLPFKLVLEQRVEVTLESAPRDMAQVQAEAGDAALRALRKLIGFDDELVDKWVDYCMIEGEVLEATATGERVIDIAKPRRNGP